MIEIKDFTNFVYNRKDSSIDFSMDDQPGDPDIDFMDANIFFKTPQGSPKNNIFRESMQINIKSEDVEDIFTDKVIKDAIEATEGY